MDHELKTIEFVSFCIEEYARRDELSGARVADCFESYGLLDYLFTNYEALHTQGAGYILSLLDELMGNGQVLETSREVAP